MNTENHKNAGRTFTGGDIWDKEAENILENVLHRSRWQSRDRDRLATELYNIDKRMAARRKAEKEKKRANGATSPALYSVQYEAPRA